MAITRQIEDCRALTQHRLWQKADVYVDDVSAYSGRRRPEYERMLGDLGAGRVDGVIVYHLDRLHRRPRELEDFSMRARGRMSGTWPASPVRIDRRCPAGAAVR